jgi:hypothetical protein
MTNSAEKTANVLLASILILGILVLVAQIMG